MFVIQVVLLFVQQSKVVHVTIGSAIELVIPLPMSFSGGYIGFGTGGYYPADFDNFKIIDGTV